MEAGRILKTLESETRDFITHNTTSSPNINIFVLVSLALKCHRGNKDGSRGGLHMQCLASQLRSTEFGKPTNLDSLFLVTPTRKMNATGTAPGRWSSIFGSWPLPFSHSFLLLKSFRGLLN